MGYKVYNRNAIIGEDTITDTIFYFETKEEAIDYVLSKKSFNEFKTNVCEDEKKYIEMIEKMTDEEKEKFSFKIPGNFQIPHKIIVRPLEIPKDEPYWIETKELLLPDNLKK